MLDVFAWIVLLILAVSAVAMIVIAGALPGHIARTRHHPQEQAVRMAGWITLFLALPLWPVVLIWAYVDWPARSGEHAMIVAIFNVYLVILFGLVKLRIVPWNMFWKISPAIVLILLLFGLFIPMGWGAPQGSAVVLRNSVAIVPNVAGEVVEVPVAANTPIKAGDVLFRIDPVPFQSAARRVERAAQARGDCASPRPASSRAPTPAAVFDVEQRQASVDQLRAQITGAQWNLDKTVVRAPADGYVTNLALRKGARVANLPLSPVMAFIDTSETFIGVEVNQIDTRYIAPQQPVEVTFKFLPGRIYSGKVVSVLQAIVDRPGPDLGRRGDAAGAAGRALRRAREAGRRGIRRHPARRQRRRCRHLHRARQGRAPHPQGAAAPDRDPELRAAVLAFGG